MTDALGLARSAYPEAEPPPGAFASHEPGTGQLVGTFAVTSRAQVTAIVEQARGAARWWGTCAPATRRRALLAWASRLVRDADELTDLVRREQGKTADEAYLELVPALEQIRWAARHAGRVLRRRHVRPNLPMANHVAAVDYLPYGVVGVIGPWNYPVFTPAGSVAYALAAGNTVVFKPSEFTPATGVFLVRAFAAANPDLPDGVLSVVTGAGGTGADLVDSGLDKVAFTGSTATGRAVMAACARTLTPLVLECGGKDPMIVAADADVHAAAKAAAWGGMSNSGQTCVGIERVYVEVGVRDRFLTALQAELTGVRPGLEPTAAYGPMTTPAQLEIVRRHVTEALGAGAVPLVGGVDSVHAPFVEPVVLVDPPDDCSAVVEETFGPVLVVRTVNDVDEAVALANSLDFGLGASVFSRRQGRAIADRIAAGMVAVNCALSFVGIPSLPFGGQGGSGFGRVHGEDGLREFARPRSYARQVMAVPGMDVATLRRRPATMRVLRGLMSVRHGRPRRGQGR
jgi:acyl-CoA reductase-like NAD-dependent aldehyde dehydrogenase